MKFFKLAAVAAALAGAALSASAMTSMQDDQLSSVTGQDGVTLAANLNINVGSFQYTNTTDNNATVSFNNIGVKGMVLMTIDVLSNATFQTAAGAAIDSLETGAAAAQDKAIVGLAVPATDVVQFAFPNAHFSHTLAPSITVGSVTLGHSTASFGSFAINNIDMQGTSVWMWAH
jgi:hypothetical protein